MTREEFEHAIRAAAAVVDDEIVVVGSQAVLAHFPNAPESLLRSMEVDVFPRGQPERAAEIDGAIGDGSPFFATYGYYAHGVGPEAIIGPAGWGGRLVRLEVPAISFKDGKAIAWCLAMHDLVLAKLAAGREHDFAFAANAIRAELVEVEQLNRGVDLMPGTHRELTRERLLDVIALI